MKVNGVKLDDVGRKTQTGPMSEPKIEKNPVNYPRLSSYNTNLDIPKGLKIGDKAIIICQVELTSYRKSEGASGEKPSIDLDFNVLKAGFQESAKESSTDKELKEVDKKLKEEIEKD